MKPFLHPQLFLRLLLIGLVVLLLTLSPRPWVLQAGLENARRNLEKVLVLERKRRETTGRNP